MRSLRGISACLILACVGAGWAEQPTVRVPAEGWQVVSFDEVSAVRADSVGASVAVAGSSRWARLAFVAHLPDPAPRGRASNARQAERAVAEAEKILTLVARELRAQAGGLPQDLRIAVVGGGFGADDFRAIVARKAAELLHASPDSVWTAGGGPRVYSVSVSARGDILLKQQPPDAGPRPLLPSGA